jgi:hypothetical protein
MARRKTISIEKTAARLVGGKPINAHYRKDGTLMVLDPQGRKVTFTPEEVAKAEKLDERSKKGNEEGG